MKLMYLVGAALLLKSTGLSSTLQQDNANFTIVNGQIYTPGLAIIDSPQPLTPEGGDTLQVAIDVSGDGVLPLPPYDPNVETGLFNITLFLTSYTTGLNLTISNGTTAGWWLKKSTESPEFACHPSSSSGSSSNFQNAGCQEVMLQESGSTVKHVNWVWPDCLIGTAGINSGNCNGQGSVLSCLEGTARGPYNISIHQAFRMNGTQYYTIFDLPIDVTNSIPINTQYSASKARPLCALRNNPLLSPSQTNSTVTPLPYQPFLGGNSSISGSNSASSSSASPAQSASSSASSSASAGDGSTSGTNSGSSGFDIDVRVVIGVFAIMAFTT